MSRAGIWREIATLVTLWEKSPATGVHPTDKRNRRGRRRSSQINTLTTVVHRTYTDRTIYLGNSFLHKLPNGHRKELFRETI